MTKNEKILLSLLDQSLKALTLIGRIDRIGADVSNSWYRISPVFLREALAFDVKIARVHVDKIEKELDDMFPVEFTKRINKN